MPRASYTPKNRFCFNSNLSEWAYLKLMYLWLRGETFTDIEAMLRERVDQVAHGMKILHRMKTLPDRFKRLAQPVVRESLFARR